MTYAENDCKENATYFTVGEEKNGENIWSKFSNIVKGKNLLKFSE